MGALLREKHLLNYVIFVDGRETMESMAPCGYPRGPFMPWSLKDDEFILRDRGLLMNAANPNPNLAGIRGPVMWRHPACSVIDPTALYNIYWLLNNPHFRNPPGGKLFFPFYLFCNCFILPSFTYE